MNYKENGGVDPITLRQGYKVLDGGPPRIRDNNMPSSPALTETENGGFLGRDEAQESDSAKA